MRLILEAIFKAFMPLKTAAVAKSRNLGCPCQVFVYR
jgi:hypothetical protein